MKPLKHKRTIRELCKRFLLVFILAHALTLAPEVWASNDGTETLPEDFHVTNTALVWVVGNPSEPRASLIRKLSKGQVVSVLSRREAWVRVAIIDGSGQGGYVLDRLLEPAVKEAIDSALASEQHMLQAESATNEYDGTDDNSSGFVQADVPKVWVVRDPSRIYDTLVRKLEEGEAVRVLSQGEIWSKVELSGTSDSGFVMNRWTRPASFRSIRRFLNAPTSESLSNLPPKQSITSSLQTAQGKGPYLVKKTVEPAGKAKESHSASESRTATRDSKAATRAQHSDLKLAGMNLPGLPFEKKEQEVADADEQGEGSSNLSITLTIVFAFSAVALLVLFALRRSKHKLGDGAMDCLGKIRIDKHSVLTLVRVPGKLLVMLKTKEGVDILREIHTGAEVAPAEARQILHDSFVGHLPKKTRGSRVEAAAGMSELSPAEALAMGGAPIPFRRPANTDPLQDRLSSARERMRRVMGSS